MEGGLNEGLFRVRYALELLKRADKEPMTRGIRTEMIKILLFSVFMEAAC